MAMNSKTSPRGADILPDNGGESDTKTGNAAEDAAAFSTDYMAERRCVLKCLPYSLVGEDFEGKELLFQRISSVLDFDDRDGTEENNNISKERMDQMNMSLETMKKCRNNEHFLELLPTMKEYRMKICNLKVAYRPAWKDGELKEGGKKSEKLHEGYLLLCLFSDRFGGADKATLLQICKDLNCDKILYEAVKKWGWESSYPLFTEEKKIINLRTAMSPDFFKSILFVARVYYALEAMGDGSKIMNKDLRYLVTNLLFKIEKESEAVSRNGDNRKRKAANAKESRQKSKSIKSSNTASPKAVTKKHASAESSESADRRGLHPQSPKRDKVKFSLKRPSKYPTRLEDSDDDDSADADEKMVVDERKPAAKPSKKAAKDKQPPLPTSSKRKSAPKKKSPPPECPLYARLDQMEQYCLCGIEMFESGLTELQHLREQVRDLENRNKKLDKIEKLMRE